LFVGLLVGNAAAQEKSYSAERFDVAVSVEEDGSLLVTETVTFNFVGGPFTFVFRELETDLTDGITNIRVAVNGRPLSEGDQPGQVEISGSDPIRVEWHLEPTSNSSHTFTLTYLMWGVVRQTDSADLLVYQPLPDEFEYTIASSTVAFTFPPTAVMSGEPVVTTDNAQVHRDDDQVILTAQNLSADETIVVQIPFAPGSLIAAPPLWQQRRIEQQATAPLWIGAAVVVFVGGLALLLMIYRRTQPSIPKVTQTIYEPPSDLPPAMAGAINGTGAEPAWANALATLFDLADRGVLRIEERSEKKWFRQQDFVIEQAQEPADLRPHEHGLLALLFETGHGRSVQVKLSELGGRISSHQWKKYAEPLKAELKTAGFVSQERQAVRGRFIGLGVLLIFLSVGLVVAVALWGNPWTMTLAGSIFLLGLIGVIMGSMLSPLTDEGASLAASWQRFASHLQDVIKGRAAVSDPNMFQRLLPYAATYGLLEPWAKWFQKEGWTKPPPYFRALSSADDGGIVAFVAMAAATSSSGGSASGAGGAAGAGAAGGGASGAG
jgi:hypothetical protein